MTVKLRLNLQTLTLLVVLGLLATTILAALHPKQAHADDLPVTHVSGTLSSNQTWTSGQVYVVDGNVRVSSGATLTIEAGAVVKGNTGGYIVTVGSGGTLVVEGAENNPVVFTSFKDDSIGGDSNSDGSSSGTYGDYGVAVFVENGATNATINIEGAEFRNATLAYDMNCSYSSNVNGVTTGSTFKSGVRFSNCPKEASIFRLNTFDVGQGYALENNNSDTSEFALAGSGRNTMNGSGQSSTLLLMNARVPSGSTWDIQNAKLVTYYLTVEGTLNIGSGTIVKPVQGNAGVLLQHNGSLTVDGTASAPVVFTSFRDDSHGGDINGDGSSTTPAVDDYGSAVAFSGTDASLSMSNVEIYYPATAIQIPYAPSGQVSLTDMSINSAYNGIEAGYGNVVFRGTMSNVSDKFIRACEWYSGACSVDATYSGWGVWTALRVRFAAKLLPCPGNITVPLTKAIFLPRTAPAPLPPTKN